MMKLRIYLCVVLFTGVSKVMAGPVPAYDWEKNRQRYTISESEKLLNELVLKFHKEDRYVIEDNQFLMYETLHRITLVNNNEAVQKNNRIFISMGGVLELVELKARAISPDGKVTYFDKSNLKEVKDEEKDQSYRIFAVEGIELGSEVEYFFTKKMYGKMYNRLYFQEDVTLKNVSFLLTCPSHLKYDFKSYYGFAEITKEESSKDKELPENRYSVSVEMVAPLKKEEFSNFDSRRQKIEFKLAYNTAKSLARMYTSEEAAKSFYSTLFDRSKEDEKTLDKFYKSLGDKTSNPLEQRIEMLESKVKSEIQIDKNARGEATGLISSVLKYKVASENGITRLLVGVYEKAGISVHPVITCSRENARFDGAFDSWTFLDNYLLFFPETKGFLCPFTFETRYPLVPAEFTEQQGLFIEPFILGSLKSALGSIETIPAIDYSWSSDNLSIDVSFSEDITSNKIHQIREFSGYNALFFGPYYDLMNEEERLKLAEQLTRQITPDAAIGKWKAGPMKDKAAGGFLLDVEFESSHLIERAGNKILFKVGELIGPQSELYRDDTRQNIVENSYNRGYDRKLTIKLPAGYTLKNGNDLLFDVHYIDKEKVPFIFKSSYEVKDDLLVIVINEYYKQIYAPVERYEDFRKVINAAADFNKVTLVLEKTN